MSRVSALISWIFTWPVVPGLIKSIWSEQHLILNCTAIVLAWVIGCTICPVSISKPCLIVRLDHRWLSSANVLLACVAKPESLSVRRRFSIVWLDGATYEPMSNLSFFKATVCLLKVIVPSVVAKRLMLPTILRVVIICGWSLTLCTSVEILASASVVRDVEVFDAWWPLSLSVSHWELVSLMLRGRVVVVSLLLLRVVIRIWRLAWSKLTWTEMMIAGLSSLLSWFVSQLLTITVRIIYVVILNGRVFPSQWCSIRLHLIISVIIVRSVSLGVHMRINLIIDRVRLSMLTVSIIGVWIFVWILWLLH